VAQAMCRVPPVARWQVVVSNPKGKDRLELRVELSEAVEPEKIQAVFQEGLKLRPEVKILGNEERLAENAPPLVDERTYEDGK